MSTNPVIQKNLIVVTGASGPVGDALSVSLQAQGKSVVRVGRGEEHAWTLGSLLDPTLLAQASAVVHVAWSMNPTKDASQALNIGGSVRIAKQCIDLGIPFIFISSLSARNPQTAYGIQKRSVEEQIWTMGGSLVRIGLFWTNPPEGLVGRALQIVRRFPIFAVPAMKVGTIRLTDAEGLAGAISVALSSKKPVRLVASSTDGTNFSELIRAGFKRRLVVVALPVWMIKAPLKVMGMFSMTSKRVSESLKNIDALAESSRPEEAWQSISLDSVSGILQRVSHR